MLQIYDNDYKYRNMKDRETLLHQPYDFRHDGLLKRLVSKRIANTTNPILKDILNYVETNLIMMMDYADVLENFYNWNHKNR